MLRKALLLCGALLLLGGLGAVLLWHVPGRLGPAGIGVVLLLAILFEQRGYKRIVDAAPGPDWLPTGERFLDPNTNVPVAVYIQPATGKRAYVRAS